MTDNLTITLAGTDYAVRRLTLRQMRDLQIGVSKDASESKDLSERIEQAYDGDLDIVVKALSRDHGDLTKNAILDLETTKAEVSAAALAVLRFSGLVPAEGEAKAPAVPVTE
jgi:hypothetical protein